MHAGDGLFSRPPHDGMLGASSDEVTHHLEGAIDAGVAGREPFATDADPGALGGESVNGSRSRNVISALQCGHENVRSCGPTMRVRR